MNHRHALLLAAVLPSLLIADVANAQTAPAPAPAPAPVTVAPSSPSAGGAPTPGTETSTDARALAETLFFTGRGLMEGGRFAQACEKFAESYRLDPAAGTLINLAVCHEKAGKIASAWGEFRQALAEAKKANKPEREQLAKDAIARLEPDLPFVSIVVPPAVRVPGLQVARNGSPLLPAAWDTELPIDPGVNEITASATDYDTETKTITIEKRQHMTVTIDPLVYHPPEKPPPPFWTAQRRLGAFIFVPGVVAAGVGTVFGVMALSKKSTSDNNCPSFDGQLRCTSAGSSAMSSAKTDAWIADFGIGLGAAAMVTGIVLVATGGEKQTEQGPPPPVGEPPKEGKATWDWRVAPGLHGVQGVLSRSF